MQETFSSDNKRRKKGRVVSISEVLLRCSKHISRFMTSKSKGLVFSASRIQMESFHGYLIRLTEANHYETPSWILQLAQLGSCPRKISLVFDDRASLAPLASLTGVEEEKLVSLVYQTSEAKRTKFGTFLVFGSPVSRIAISRSSCQGLSGMFN